jgi:hypothetical protein
MQEASNMFVMRNNFQFTPIGEQGSLSISRVVESDFKAGIIFQHQRITLVYTVVTTRDTDLFLM